MVKCLSRIEMVCDNARALAAFYQLAFGFVELERTDGVTDGRHHSIRMHLGRQEIALIDVRPRCRRIEPALSAYCDRRLKHGQRL